MALFRPRRRRPPNLAPVRATVDRLAADITALHVLAFHPGRACREVDPATATAETYGRCTEILRRGGKLP